MRAALLALLLIACSGKGGDDADDTGGDASSTDDTHAEEARATVTYTFTEILSQAPVKEATVAVGDEVYTTDSSGVVAIEHDPASAVALTLTVDRYPVTDLALVAPDADGSMSFQIPSESTLAALSGYVGVEADPERGNVAITLADNADGSLEIPGVTIDLDVDYDVALVADSTAAVGYAGGKTTNEGAPATVIFVNVEAGALTVSLDLSDGWSCPDGSLSFDLTAGHYGIDRLGCELEAR